MSNYDPSYISPTISDSSEIHSDNSDISSDKSKFRINFFFTILIKENQPILHNFYEQKFH